MEDATYQMALMFQKEFFFKYSFRKSIFDLDKQISETMQSIIEVGHIRIIPAKFGRNPTSSLGGDIL